MDDPLTIRFMSAADVPLGMRLKEAVGWNQLAADWKLFLDFRPRGCFLAEWGGVPVGTATSIVYDEAIGWVGMVLVDSQHRRRGIGTQLLRAALDSLETACHTIKLDATPEGREVYLRLGFRDEFTIERRVCAQLPSIDDEMGMIGTVETMTDADLDDVLDLDQLAFGVSRATVIESLRSRAPKYALVLRIDGVVRGFCLGRHGSRYEQIGPVVCEERGGAQALVSSFMRQAEKASVVDAFTDDHTWLEFLDNMGFHVERQLIRMSRGDASLSGDNGLQWAAAGPEIG